MNNGLSALQFCLVQCSGVYGRDTSTSMSIFRASYSQLMGASIHHEVMVSESCWWPESLSHAKKFLQTAIKGIATSPKWFDYYPALHKNI